MAEKRVETLYTDTTRFVGAANYNMITIMDANVHEYANDPKNRELTGGQQIGIVGVLQNNFTYSINADWQAKLANINLSPVKQAIKGMTGDTSNTGIITEKFYQGASYLTISPKFRVVDWAGKGDVVQTAIKVINKLLPIGNNKTVSEVYGTGKEFVGKVSESAREIIGDEIITAGSKPITYIKNQALATTTAALGTINRYLWGEPEPVRIKIGNFFDMNNMILESATVEFSKEMTSTGPLYADFDCQFSSKLALVKYQTGLVARDETGRQVRVGGAFAEDRAFARADAERWQRYNEKYAYANVEESWLLSKINDAYGSNVTGDALEGLIYGR